MSDVELSILGNISADTQIGVLLGSIKHLRPTAEVYGIFAKYKYIGKSVYFGVTICFVDKDAGEEMETAAFEFSVQSVGDHALKTFTVLCAGACYAFVGVNLDKFPCVRFQHSTIL